ncbi:hypothetical protein UA08_08583 [Talaromyces atroroseus]|uniref:Uncharacterized protein n=1 Tax=Talaromyces atroroseus TaxID=1441469 RepID=A0A1Q5Q7G4_TALAT|nr:hypothetical protein UA08_08583 [Talaromyces atroroseus]OKL56165.1 hypothetical protein UA08_08583 [Talaromyces atroroseus]
MSATMLHLPAEILAEIIRAAVDIIPVRDLLKLRFLNAFCAKEVMAVLIESQRLEDDGFGFAYEDRHEYDPCRRDYNEKWWLRFPARYKRQYLHRKMQEHPARRCVFSTFVQGVLDVPHEPRTVEQETLLTDKLIDAWLCGKFVRVRDVLDPSRYESYQEWYYEMHHDRPGFITAHWEDFDKTLPIALAASAIRNGNCVELQAVIDRYSEELRKEPHSINFLERQSDRLGGVCPLDVAAKYGSGDIIKVLLRNQCGISYFSYAFYTSALSVAARSGNKEALKVWIDHMKNINNDITIELRRAVNNATKIGKFDMVKFIEEECGFQFDNREVLYDSFVDAIQSRKLDVVQKFLDRGGFDINMKTRRRPNGALFAAISRTRSPNLSIVSLLLANGVDLNDVHGRTHLTPLQTAVKMQHFELTKLLIEHGANAHTPIYDPHKKTMMPLLHVAIQNRSTPMVRLLLAQGLEREYTWKGKKHEVKGDPKEGCGSEVWYQIVKWHGKQAIYEHDGYVVVIGG